MSKSELDHLVYKEFSLQPDDGLFDALHVVTFVSAVGVGMFLDRDGYGTWAVKAGGGYWLVDASFGNDVRPSKITSGEQTIPAWATHVIWRST